MYVAALLWHHIIVIEFFKYPCWSASANSTVWYCFLQAAAMNGHNESVLALLANYTSMQRDQRPPVYYKDVIESVSSRGRAQTLETILDAPHFRAQGEGILGCAFVSATRDGHDGCVRIVKERGDRSPEGKLPGTRRSVLSLFETRRLVWDFR